MKCAQDKVLVTVAVHDLRDYAAGKHRQVDDYAYGGGGGMVLMIEPVARCLAYLQGQRSYEEVIYMSPDGVLLTQKEANGLSLLKNIIILVIF